MKPRSAIAMLLLAVSVPAMSQPITMVMKATIGYISNEERETWALLGPAVSDSSIPFQVGQEIRVVFTYDPSAIAIPPDTQPACAWSFAGASTFFFTDQFSASAPQTVSKVHRCGLTQNTFGIGGPEDAGDTLEPIEDLPFLGATADLYVDPICFGTNATPVLPATGFTAANNCQLINALGAIKFNWKKGFAGNTRTVEVGALNNVSIEFASNAALTPALNDVTLDPVVELPAGGFTTVQVSGSVFASGTTTVTASATPTDGAAPPSGFKLGDPSVYYDVDTTASFNGDIELCFYWQDGQVLDEATADLLHYENGDWTVVTTKRDVVANRVCGLVATLSPFAVVERAFAFNGFLQPVDNHPIRNVAKAGSSIPIKFSLNGDQGTLIFASGYPAAQSIACDTSAPLDVIDETAAAGASGLSYDADSDEYTYVWKTDKTWTGSCRRFSLKFRDGSVQSVDFSFQK